MQTKKFLIGNVFLALAGVLVFSLAAISKSGNKYFNARGDYTPYSIVLETNKNKIAAGPFSTATYTGTGVATTELGNSVTFDFNSLYNPTNMWQTIKAGGYITNTQPIMGMTSISLTKNSSSANFKIYWSNNNTFSEARQIQFDSSSSMTVSTDFGGYLPNYIKIAAIANSAISSGAIEFSCSNHYPTLALSTNSSSMGSVSGSGVYAVGQSVTINASPNAGYSFVGWYSGEMLISSASSYTFAMPFTDTDYVAKFSVNSYVLTLISNDTNKGTVSGSGTYAYGAEVTATATEIAGNEFIGWYQSSTLLSANSTYTFAMPYNALSLEARFVTQYNVDISSFDELLGTVSGGGAHGYTTSVTITATATMGNFFVAWYDDSFNTVSTNPVYTFIMASYNVTFYAEFSKTPQKGGEGQFGKYPQSIVTDSALISTLNSAAGSLPSSENNQTWTDYGYYISGTVSSYMWYIDLVNSTNEYRGVYFTSYRPYENHTDSSTANTYQDDNGYNTSSVYWFKYEPITWRVLDVQSGNALLMADLILDSQDYYYSMSNRTIDSATVYPNNYQYSYIRSWLNDNFYSTAFSTEEKARIQTSTIDNSPASTGNNPNQYACANTSDKVFLLSYVEATNATYGMNTTEARKLQPSPYSQAQGAYTYDTYGYWWTRSPVASYSLSVRLVDGGGGTQQYYSDLDHITRTSIGVVPAMWISTI